MAAQDRIIQLRTRFAQFSEEPIKGSAGASASGGEPPWTPLERRVAKLEEDVGDIKQTLRDLAPRIIETHAAIQPMRDDIGLLKSQYGEIVRDVASSKTDLSKEIADTPADLSKEIADTRTDLSKAIVDMRSDLSKEISEVRTEVAEVKGVVSKLPSVATIIGVVIGAMGVVFAGLAVLAYIDK